MGFLVDSSRTLGLEQVRAQTDGWQSITRPSPPRRWSWATGAGDACLRALADMLRPRIDRAGDILARYGGEEFVIALAGMDLAGTVTLAEELRKATDRLRVEFDGKPLRFTASFGVVSCHKPHSAWTTWRRQQTVRCMPPNPMGATPCATPASVDTSVQARDILTGHSGQLRSANKLGRNLRQGHDYKGALP